MAEFCNKCANEIEGIIPEIDVLKEFEELQPEYVSSGFICEGCGLIAITRTENNELKVIRLKGDENTTFDWEDY